MVCNQATGLPAIPVLQLSGQVLVANHGCKFCFCLFMPLIAMQRNAARRFFPLWLIALVLWNSLAGRCGEGLKSVLKN